MRKKEPVFNPRNLPLWRDEIFEKLSKNETIQRRRREWYFYALDGHSNQFISKVILQHCWTQSKVASEINLVAAMLKEHQPATRVEQIS